jgi:hypothetical protein
LPDVVPVSARELDVIETHLGAVTRSRQIGTGRKPLWKGPKSIWSLRSGSIQH